MKQALFLGGLAAGLAVAATPAQAQTAGMPFTGSAGVNYATTDTNGGGDVDAWGVDGSAAYSTGAAIGLAAGLSYASSDAAGVDVSSVAVDGHLFFKTDESLVGGFISYNNVDAGIGDFDVLSLGGEGQFVVSDHLILAGAATWGQTDDAFGVPGADVDGWAVDGVARVFVTENLRLQGNAGWINLDAGGADADMSVLGVGAEYQLSAAPISFTGGYTRQESDDIGIENDTFKIGLRFNFGGATLKARNDSGADLSGISSFNSALAR